MKVISYDVPGTEPRRVNATTVIVYDVYENPIVVVAEVQPDIHTVVSADDPDFNRILAGLGINKVVIDTPLIPSKEIPADAKIISGPFGSVQ